MSNALTTPKKPARFATHIPIDDPRNVVMHDLRRIDVARVYLDLDAQTVLALRTIRNIAVEPGELNLERYVDNLRSVGSEFGWPETGRLLVHLRTMSAEEVLEVPEPTDPSAFAIPEPAPLEETEVDVPEGTDPQKEVAPT